MIIKIFYSKRCFCFTKTLLAFSPVGRKRKLMRMTISEEKIIKHEGGRPKKVNCRTVNKGIRFTEKEYFIGGTWYDANGMYYFIISQDGNALSATSYSMAGLPTGQGTGSINGNNVLLNINVTGYGIFSINTTLSENEKVLHRCAMPAKRP